MSDPATGQASDVEIAGVGYALAPGGYKRASDGELRRLSGRVEIAGFAAGQLVPFQRRNEPAASPAGGWGGQGCGPAYGGAGVEPFPHRETFADAIASQPTTAQRAVSVVQGDRCYVGIGARLYRTGPLTDAAWSPLSPAATLGAGATIGDLTLYKDDVMLLLGPALAMRKYNPQAGALADPWVAGEVGVVGVGYKGELVYAQNKANGRYVARLSATHVTGALDFSVRNVDAPIVRCATFGGKAAIATRQSLFLFGGDWSPGRGGTSPIAASWTGEIEPIFSHGTYSAESDFVFLLPFLGKLYTWVGNRVAVYDPAEAGWTAAGPVGRACYGAAVAAGWLVVALEAEDGGSELWGATGDGWWRLRREEPGSPVKLVWPAATGGVGNRDLVVFRANSSTYELFRLIPRAGSGGGLPTYGEAAEWRSPLLDAGDRAAAKTWLRVGAAFAVPEGRGLPGSADAAAVALDWSVDAGQTWTTAAVRAGSYARALELVAKPPPGTAARFLQLRVRWESVLDWAPVLTGLWADWLQLDLPPARRRWELKVRVRDRLVRRDGGVDPRSGRAQIADLWAAWQTGAPVPFRDLDFDADPVERSVRVVAVAQEEPKPADAGRWGDGVVALKLVEA